MMSPEIYPQSPYRYRVLKNGPKGVEFEDFYWLSKANRSLEEHVAQGGRATEPESDYYAVIYDRWGKVIRESNP